MDPMSAELAKALITERLAQARARQPGRQIDAERRAGRRRRRRLAMVRWWRNRVVVTPQASNPQLAVAATAADPSPTRELAGLLEEAAHRIAEEGTCVERALFEAMSQVASDSAPGASAALVDPEGSEASRLRAFGVVHAHLLDVLGPREHAWLLDLLDDGGRLELPGRVA
jgi:hypothetical protein